MSATPHGQKTIRASRAVILATGGYDWDSDLVRPVRRRAGRPEILVQRVRQKSPGMVCGFGHDVGGMVAALPSQMNIMQVGVCMKNGSRDQADFRGFTPFFPHSIVVNKKGMRFADEAFHPAMAAAVQMFDGATHGCPNWPAWLITDARERTLIQLRQMLSGSNRPTRSQLWPRTVVSIHRASRRQLNGSTLSAL